MKHVLPYIIILYNVVLLAGCRGATVTPDEVPQPQAEAERTVIVYMAGDNSLSSQIREDTTEMAKGRDMIPENVSFIIYLDDAANFPAVYELSKQNGMQLWKQYGEELCSTDSLTMLGVLKDIEQNFPARHYGLTFWSHATGWAPRRKTFGIDDHPASGKSVSEMEITVLRDVLAQLPRSDYIFFDACFMQGVEVAYELRDVTNYVVGSPAEIPGPGAPYEKIMDALCTADVKGLVEGYVGNYPRTYNGVSYPGVLLSCIDCTQLEPLAQLTGTLLTPFYMGRAEPSAEGFQAYCDLLYEKYTHCLDMRTTMCRLLPEEDYALWTEAFDKAVPLRALSPTNRWFALYCSNAVVKDTECYGGVSMFVPMEKYDACGWNVDFRNTSWYEAAEWGKTGW